MPNPSKVIMKSGPFPDWRLVVERRAGNLAVLENLALLKEQSYDVEKPGKHDHPGETGDTAVIVLDLHRTLTPSQGFIEPTEDTGLAAPFPLVKECLDQLAAGGCCLHIATAGLSPMHSPVVLEARRKAVYAWIQRWGLPISYVTGKVSAHSFYDDRMVPVGPDGDWEPVMTGVMAGLNKRYELDDAGIWRRKDIKEVGSEFEFPPPDTIIGDQPRPLSTPIVDIDMHRCLTQASSSSLDAKPKPGAVEAVRAIYDAGYRVHLSCQGWDPLTHTIEVSAQRLAGMRQWCRKWGIPWDEFVAKSHADPSFVDDKGVAHTDWATDLPLLLAHLSRPDPHDEVTLLRDEDSNMPVNAA